MDEGNYALIKVTTDNRVIGTNFPIAMYGVVSDVPSWKERGFGAYFSFVTLSVDRFELFKNLGFDIMPSLRW